MTFRLRGHEEASGTKYVPQKLFEIWQLKDPIKNYEQWLIETNVLNEMKVAEIRNEFKEKIESELAIGFNHKPVVADTEEELEDVYAESGARSRKS
jgi:2-oxoisovalerate dehydrogenase E1 component